MRGQYFGWQNENKPPIIRPILWYCSITFKYPSQRPPPRKAVNRLWPNAEKKDWTRDTVTATCLSVRDGPTAQHGRSTRPFANLCPGHSSDELKSFTTQQHMLRESRINSLALQQPLQPMQSTATNLNKELMHAFKRKRFLQLSEVAAYS